MNINSVKIGVICIMLLFTSLLCACTSITISPADDHGSIYSRKYTEYMCSRANFGYGRDDDVYIALKHIYENQDIIDKYGSSFEVVEKDSGGSSEIQTFLFLFINKGNGEYFFKIDNDVWIVELTKSYFGKWEVSNCYIDNE